VNGDGFADLVATEGRSTQHQRDHDLGGWESGPIGLAIPQPAGGESSAPTRVRRATSTATGSAM
jgi:hypothetical protein